jgi:uncharacterized protein YggE
MPPLIIVVSGSSKIARRAERAVVSLYISSQGPNQQQVISEVTSTAKLLQSTLRQLSIKDLAEGKPENLSDSVATPPITHWSMSTLSTGSYAAWYGANRDDKEGEKTKQYLYNAHTTFEIKFADFTTLGSLCSDFANTPLVSVKNISWRLTEKTKASLAGESRKLAVEDAVTQARDLAAAVGKAAIKPLEINADSTSPFGVGTTRPTPGGLFGQTRAAAQGRGGPAADALNFEPEEVELSCTVRIRFEAE